MGKRKKKKEGREQGALEMLTHLGCILQTGARASEPRAQQKPTEPDRATAGARTPPQGKGDTDGNSIVHP